MTVEQAMSDFSALPFDDQLKLVQAIWGRLPESSTLELSDAARSELARPVASYTAAPSTRGLKLSFAQKCGRLIHDCDYHQLLLNKLHGGIASVLCALEQKDVFGPMLLPMTTEQRNAAMKIFLELQPERHEETGQLCACIGSSYLYVDSALF